MKKKHWEGQTMDPGKVGKKLENAGAKMQDVGKKLNRIANILILCVTIPILLTVFLGTTGLIIGGVVFLIGLGRAFK
jgi:uncharacterized membrane protein